MATRDTTAGTSENDEKQFKNKPKASKLRQQKLPAWQPILTASTVIPTVIGVGVVFIPIGIALFLASNSVMEYKLDYTDCQIGTSCVMELNVTDDMLGDVYIYYSLENFYQNHRRYVKSRNDKQYLGELDSVTDCEPFDYGYNLTGSKLPIAPCGAIANSMFNDTFTLMRLETGFPTPVPLTKDGVLWNIDKEKKFKNPDIPPGGTLCSAFQGTLPPPNWVNRLVPLCDDEGFQNVDFIVWMRTAALPTFRKLWRLVDRTDATTGTTYREGLPRGQYRINVNSRNIIPRGPPLYTDFVYSSIQFKIHLNREKHHKVYPVKVFGGRKSVILSTTSWAGGKNAFLGIAYLVVGSLALVLALVFIVIHVKFGHSVNDLSDVGPNQLH